MITIIDYGSGNIRAFINVYERMNIPISIAKTAEDFMATTKIILPGVGSFDDAMGRLNSSGMREAIEKLVLDRRLPLIGICVGMQMIANSSEEGKLPGLGWIDGIVKRLDSIGAHSTTQLPHMGWNNILKKVDNPLLDHLNDDSRFYFLHTYYLHCNSQNDVIASTQYGIEFTSVVNKHNLYGVQFHPEKSHQWGMQLLKNFADL